MEYDSSGSGGKEGKSLALGDSTQDAGCGRDELK
jgi:hypothetical protein